MVGDKPLNDANLRESEKTKESERAGKAAVRVCKRGVTSQRLST